MKYGAILLAAGKGNRYNDVKQDIEFHGKAGWRYPYDLLVSILGKENAPSPRVITLSDITTEVRLGQSLKA